MLCLPYAGFYSFWYKKKVLKLNFVVQLRYQRQIQNYEALICFMGVWGQFQILLIMPILIGLYISSILASQIYFGLRTLSVRPLTLCRPVPTRNIKLVFDKGFGFERDDCELLWYSWIQASSDAMFFCSLKKIHFSCSIIQTYQNIYVYSIFAKISCICMVWFFG